MNNKKKILVIDTHTDDGEFGCGGTISRFLDEKKEIYYAAFSTARESVPNGLPENILEIEVRNATKVLGINSNNLIIYGFTVRKLNYVRQEILEKLVKLKKEIDPDLILLPSDCDLHQDHFTVAKEGQRAFKDKSILAYELPWNNITFQTRCFIELEKIHIDRKINAIKEYKSQQKRAYANPEFIESLAITRGVQIGVKYAESFEVVRWVI